MNVAGPRVIPTICVLFTNAGPPESPPLAVTSALIRFASPPTITPHVTPSRRSHCHDPAIYPGRIPTLVPEFHAPR